MKVHDWKETESELENGGIDINLACRHEMF